MRLLLTLVVPLALAGSVAAQSITVDLALDDFTDFGGGQTVADLPGPDGHVTFREAVYAANNTPGPQTINFAIPFSEWSIFYNDRAVIRLDLMLYFSDSDTTVDFTTQTAFTGDTNPEGGEVALQYAGGTVYLPCLWLAAQRCLIRGLGNSFGNNTGGTLWITGSSNRVVGGVTGGLLLRGFNGTECRFNVIGGPNPGDGNVFAGRVDLLSNADDNVLIGNTFRGGMRIIGDTTYGTCDRNRVGGPTSAERNCLAGYGRYGEEGDPYGIQLEVSKAADTLIENNYVGTTNDGMAQYPGASGTRGIQLGIGADHTLVRDNLVAGILMVGGNHYQGLRFGIAIAVVASATNTILTGNRVGLAADGLSPIPCVEGIVVASDPNGSPLSVQIGGTDPGAANHVAFQETTGVRVSGTANGVNLSGNSIHDNGSLGIDLVGAAGFGVTANDPLDADTGGNQLQNFPVLTGATSLRVAGSNFSLTKVSGRLRSAPSQSYRVEFFANSTSDPSGHGEGETYLGWTTVSTDAQGNARFSVGLVMPDLAGQILSATATDALGNTSEFSEGLAISSLNPQSPR